MSYFNTLDACIAPKLQALTATNQVKPEFNTRIIHSILYMCGSFFEQTAMNESAGQKQNPSRIKAIH
jgi:hypothetical protein